MILKEPAAGSIGTGGITKFIFVSQPDWNCSTKAIDVPTTERLTPLLCGFGELPIPAETKILFGPVERPERRESKNKAIPLKILNA